MRFWLMFTITILTGCTITVKPLPTTTAKKKTYHSSRQKPSTVKVTKHKLHTVDSQWITNYKNLEREHGGYTIPGDQEIIATPDGKFRVPQSVIDHFQDLSRAPDTTPILSTTPPPALIAPPP